MRAIIRSLDVDPAHTVDTFTLLILIQVVRASRSTPCRLQQRVVGPAAVLTLVQQDVQRLLIDPCLGELHLCYSRDPITDFNSAEKYPTSGSLPHINYRIMELKHMATILHFND